jgi:hypothetical protein
MGLSVSSTLGVLLKKETLLRRGFNPITVLEELRLAFLNFEMKADDGAKTFNMFGDMVPTLCQLSDLFQNHESESRVVCEVMKVSSSVKLLTATCCSSPRPLIFSAHYCFSF